MTLRRPGDRMGLAMHTIFKDFTFAAAHAIRGHTRGCQNLHGHNYRVRVHLAARRLDELGMVLDFADLKAMRQEILGPFDHRVINGAEAARFLQHLKKITEDPFLLLL